jgi:thioredoxin reductase (NADPH)
MGMIIEEFFMNLNLQPAEIGAEKVYDVLIIGGGPAGSTAAIYSSRAQLSTLIIDKGLTTGALGITGKIANYPGVIDRVSGSELLERMRNQALSFGTEFVTDKVIGVDLNKEEKIIYCNNSNYTGKTVIIATGSMGRGTRVQGEERLIGHGVSYCATCDGAFFRNQEVVVAGNNDEAIEEALFLTRFVNKVHFLSPGLELKAPTSLIKELTNNPKVIVYMGAVLREIIGQKNVEAIRFVSRESHEQTIPVSGAFIYLQGGKPITDFVKGYLEINETGCLTVDNEYKTGLPGVFAVGDVLCNHIKQVVVSAGEGAVAGMAAEKFLRGRKQFAVDWKK